LEVVKVQWVVETGATMFSYIYPYGNVYSQSLTMMQSMALYVFPFLFMIGKKFLGAFYQNALPISCPYLRQYFPSTSTGIDTVYVDKN
jgi:hypothetical protein